MITVTNLINILTKIKEDYGEVQVETDIDDAGPYQINCITVLIDENTPSESIVLEDAINTMALQIYGSMDKVSVDWSGGAVPPYNRVSFKITATPFQESDIPIVITMLREEGHIKEAEYLSELLCNTPVLTYEHLMNVIQSNSLYNTFCINTGAVLKDPSKNINFMVIKSVIEKVKNNKK